jgi:hypothetical protein
MMSVVGGTLLQKLKVASVGIFGETLSLSSFLSRTGGAQRYGFIYGCIWGFDYKAIELWLRSGVDNWFFRHAVRWLVPRRFLDGAAFESLSHQLSNFLTTKGNEVAVLFPVKLRTKIKPVNSWIISIHNQKVLWLLEQLSPFHKLSLLRSQRNPQFVRDCPTIVAASSKTTQSFVLALSSWIGTRVPCDCRLKMVMNKAYVF